MKLLLKQQQFQPKKKQKKKTRQFHLKKKQGRNSFSLGRKKRTKYNEFRRNNRQEKAEKNLQNLYGTTINDVYKHKDNKCH